MRARRRGKQEAGSDPNPTSGLKKRKKKQPNVRRLWPRSRLHTDLPQSLKSYSYQQVRDFWQMVEHSTDGVLNMREARRSLDIPRSRIYDISCALEGAGVLAQTSRITLRWISRDVITKPNPEVQRLEGQEKKLDELLESALEQLYHMCEDEASQRFLYLSYEDVKTSVKEQTVIVVKAPAETLLELHQTAEIPQIYMKSTQGPINVYLCSEDHSPFDVPEDHSTDDDADDSNAEPQTVQRVSSTGAADDLSGDTATAEHIPPLSAQAASPSPTPLASLPPPHPSSSSDEVEEEQTFATLTTPLALSLGGEDYLLSLGEDYHLSLGEDYPVSLGEDRGISDLFSTVEPDGGVWKGPVQANPPI